MGTIKEIKVGDRVRSAKLAELVGVVLAVGTVLDRSDPSWSDPQITVRYADGGNGRCRASQLVKID